MNRLSIFVISPITVLLLSLSTEQLDPTSTLFLIATLPVGVSFHDYLELYETKPSEPIVVPL